MPARLHRSDRGGSTPPSRRRRVANFDSEAPALTRTEHGASPWQPTISPTWLSSDSSSFVNCRAFAPRECESLRRPHCRIRGETTIILRFERRVCRWESCRMHQFTGMWLNPNSRGSRLRIWQPWGCNSLHAHHFTATGFSGNSRPRRLKIAEPSGCKSRVADRRVVNRE